MTTAGWKRWLGPEWSVRAHVQGWGRRVPGLRAGSQVTEAFKYLLINVFICVFVKPKAGALLTPCQVDSGKGSSFQVTVSRTVKLGKLQKAGTGPGALDITWRGLLTQWKSRDSNSEVCLALDWVAGRGGGLPASGGASHGFMVQEDFCIE